MHLSQDSMLLHSPKPVQDNHSKTPVIFALLAFNEIRTMIAAQGALVLEQNRHYNSITCCKESKTK